jgi:Nucleotidyl transferase of unknown function (DUF2204)
VEFNSDFADLLQAFNAAGVEYVVVGAYAVALHARPRATGDFDVFVRPSAENAERTYRALAAFGAPLRELTVADLSAAGLVFQIGVAPLRIDVITAIDGVSFDEAWSGRVRGSLNGIDANVIGREQLIANKRAAGRPQDLADLETLLGA